MVATVDVVGYSQTCDEAFSRPIWRRGLQFNHKEQADGSGNE